MKNTSYKFKKTDYSFGLTKGNKIRFDYGVEIYDDTISALNHIESWAWTPEEIQKIIDDANKLEGDNHIDYQVEGGYLGISIFTSEVYFFNLFEPNESGEEDFRWPFEKFITFLEDFKKFIEDNPH